MAIERHLILQELTLRPSGEWTPQFRGWLVARVAEGSGYWLHDGPARELNAGDGFVMSGNVRALLRASQLGLLKLQYFTVQPQYLNGLLSVLEWHQLEAAAASPSTPVFFFSAGESIAQKIFAHCRTAARSRIVVALCFVTTLVGRAAGFAGRAAG